MEFERALPRLVSAHDQGLLVPFLGAGMSVGACPDWKDMIQRLEAEAELAPVEPGEAELAADLVRRANTAVRILKRRKPGEFPRAVRRALYPAPDGPSPFAPQTNALAQIWWPLVLTTNYDDLFARAYLRNFSKEHDRLHVLGRSPQDCQRVLSSLNATTNCLLWALQGYLPREREPDHALKPLQDEMVVGHEEYRRVTHTALHFRRAFAEVFRRRSLLFLGSSLAETYLLDLFGEILEFAGANPLPHYAMVRRGEVDKSFLRSRFNIVVLEYDDHGRLPVWLSRLHEMLRAERSRVMQWRFTLRCPQSLGDYTGSDELRIKRGVLPKPRTGESAMVSAGNEGGFLRFGASMQRYIGKTWASYGPFPGAGAVLLSPSYVYGHRDPSGKPLSVVALAARAGGEKDLRIIGQVVEEALDWAAGERFHQIHMQLLAAGPDTPYPPRFSLAETIRAFGRWTRRRSSGLRLSVYITDPGALFEISTGRMNVVELLTCDDVRFWIEVVDNGRVMERELVFASPETTIGKLAGQFDVPSAGWMVEAEPAPTRERSRSPLAAIEGDTLAYRGVLPGSTLRFIAPAKTGV
jgi:hypothetical protein